MCHSRYEKKYLQVIIACIQTQNNHEILFNISFNNHLQLNLFPIYVNLGIIMMELIMLNHGKILFMEIFETFASIIHCNDQHVHNMYII
jgi:hypothetical protein